MKTLEEIQEENRKLIGKPLTLSRVLNSLGNKTFFTKNGKVCFSYEKWGIQNGFNRVIGYGRVDWDLTKEALEEQSEETQRKFNELIKQL